MKNKKIFKTFSAFCAAFLLLTGMSVTVFAQGEEADYETAHSKSIIVNNDDDTSQLTPEGNAALVDDFGGSKQLITITTKAGNYFYILIDRDSKDKNNAVHFLNQVDDADLEALIKDDKTQKTSSNVCSCTEKCKDEAVNRECPVCSANMSGCKGKEITSQEKTSETDSEEKQSGGLSPAVLILIIALIAAGGAFVYFKFIRKKSDAKVNNDADDYDCDKYESDTEDEEWDTEEHEETDE